MNRNRPNSLRCTLYTITLVLLLPFGISHGFAGEQSEGKYRGRVFIGDPGSETEKCHNHAAPAPVRTITSHHATNAPNPHNNASPVPHPRAI